MSRERDELLSTDESELVSRLAGLVPVREAVDEGRILFLAGQQEALAQLGGQRLRTRWLTAAALLLVSVSSGAAGWQYGSYQGTASVLASAPTGQRQPWTAPHALQAELPGEGNNENQAPELAAAKHGRSTVDLLAEAQNIAGPSLSLDRWIDQLLERHGSAPLSWSIHSLPDRTGDGLPGGDSEFTQATLRRELFKGDLQ
jgi:hypothetical protein